MIRVVFYKDSDHCYTGFRLKGHAGFAEHGHDIVCAAVSALSINTINSIEAFTKDVFDCRVDEKKGLMQLKFSSKVSNETTLLLDSFQLGLNGIREDNNAEYISVITEEV